MKFKRNAIARIAVAVGMLGGLVGCSGSVQTEETLIGGAMNPASLNPGLTSSPNSSVLLNGTEPCKTIRSTKLQLATAVHSAAAEPDVFNRESLLSRVEQLSEAIATCKGSTSEQILIETAQTNERFRDSLITLVAQPEGKALGVSVNDLLTRKRH